eukprot:9472986-Pyramimonas_sp.AAC.1
MPIPVPSLPYPTPLSDCPPPPPSFSSPCSSIQVSSPPHPSLLAPLALTPHLSPLPSSPEP